MSRSKQRSDFSLSSMFDINKAPIEGGRRHLIIDLVPPGKLEVEGRRQPLELAFVVDASGSMGGGKLEAVKEGLERIVAALAPEDRVSLVSFASDVQVHVDNAACDAAGRAAFLEELARLATRGSTDLSAGWLAGCGLLVGERDGRTGARPGSMQCVIPMHFPKHHWPLGDGNSDLIHVPSADSRQAPARQGSHRRAVILLSDGHANQGIVDHERLASLAGDFATRGVTTTCVGVGEGYSTRQLGAISDASGGRFHHANDCEQIVEVLLGELDEHEQIAATQLELQVSTTKGVQARILGPVQGETRRGVHRALVGSLSRGAPRKIVVAMDLPPGEAGQVREMRVALVGVDFAGKPLRLRAKASIAHGDCAGLAPSEADALLVTRRMSDWLGQQALNHNEAGDFQRVVELRSAHADALRDYMLHSSVASLRVERLFLELDRASLCMDDSQRKQLYVRARKSLQEERDLRRDIDEQP